MSKRKSFDLFKTNNKKQHVESKFKLFNEDEIKWSFDLKRMWELICEKQFIVLSGGAGTGKSFLTKDIIKLLKEHSNLNVSVTAPTNNPAIKINGITVFKWFGHRLAKKKVSEIKSDCKPYHFNTYRTTDILFIDEISMLNVNLFTKMSKIVGWAHKSTHPFGRLKIVMIGDFLQLPPVNGNYLFTCDVWKSMEITRYFLNHVYRQKDIEFINILNNVRFNKMTPKCYRLLESRRIEPTGEYIKLCTNNKDVNNFNCNKLKSLGNRIYCSDAEFWSEYYHSKKKIWCKSKKQTFNIDMKKFSVNNEFYFSVGAQVMSKTTISDGIVNGTTGIIKLITDDYIKVDFNVLDKIITLDVRRTGLYYEESKKRIVCYQFPIVLSWAMTIHVSQGLTIDRALINCNIFENGHLYTALSRMRSFDGLFIEGKIKNKVSLEAITFEQYLPLKIVIDGALNYPDSKVGKVFKNNISIADFNVFKNIKSFI
jgi:ATP-dependent DNA helicase PIF1